MIFGRVNADGTIAAGSGFTVDIHYTGYYYFTFSPVNIPSTCLVSGSSINQACIINPPSYCGSECPPPYNFASVSCYDSGTIKASADSAFSFVCYME